jgi:hypothetical protein
MPTPSKRRSAPPLSNEERAVALRVAEQLQGELGELLSSLPEPQRGGAAMARALDVDRSTCQRVAHAVRAGKGGLEVLKRAPGVEGLRRFAAALGKRGIAKGGLRRAEDAFVAFERLIERHGGSQASLVRRIESLPLTSEQALDVGLAAALREQAFDALAVLTGRHLEVQSNVMLIRPDPQDGKRAQVVGARYMTGLHGRAGAPPVAGIFFARAHDELPSGQPRPVPLDAPDSEDEPSGSTLLPGFCSEDLPPIRTNEMGDTTVELIDPQGMSGQPIDLATAHRLEPAILHPALQSNRRLELYHHVVIPTRLTILCAYLHRSMASHCLVSACVHQRSVEPKSEGPDPWFDRLDQPLAAEVLGQELSAAHHPDQPRQVEFLTELFRRADWAPSEFIGYRLVLKHALWACRHTLAFEFSQGAVPGGE